MKGVNGDVSGRVKRIVQILELIQKEPDSWTCGKQGIHFSVSKQQINRDIQKLRWQGFDIRSSMRGCRLVPEKTVTPR